jgi:cis-3,4-dihydrophenanthrene-3,4-diol dehydrogenase
VTASRLDGQVAVVTGAGSGIGRAVVERFVAEGALVIALDRDPARVAAVSDGRKVHGVTGDVRDAAAHEETVRTALHLGGRLDTWVGVAGVHDWWAPLARQSNDELVATWREVMDVNVLGYLIGVRSALPALRASRGSVVLTASTSSRHAGGGGVAYVASKHAVVGVVRQLAHELAPDVRVNAVAPGPTATALRAVAAGRPERSLAGRSDLLAAAAAGLPIPRAADPAEHTGCYVLLAARDDSPLVTGVVLPSDGGMDVRGTPLLAREAT